MILILFPVLIISINSIENDLKLFLINNTDDFIKKYNKEINFKYSKYIENFISEN